MEDETKLAGTDQKSTPFNYSVFYPKNLGYNETKNTNF